MRKRTIEQALAAPILVAVIGFTVAPVADAARAGGGGNHAGGAHAGGGGNRTGGAKPHASNVKADTRTNNVRNTSVNNVNVNRNVNVNVEGGGCCHNGWDNDYHPIATAAAVTATVAVTSAVIGSIVRSVPPGCVPVNYGGMVYQQCGNVWYQSQGPQYIVVNPPY
jgi:hypothetical protein